MGFNRGLAFKMMIFIFSSVTLIFAVFIYVNNRLATELVEKNIKDKAKLLTSETVLKVEKILASVQKVPDNISKIIQKTDFDEKRMNELLKLIVKNNAEIYGATIAFEPYEYDKNKKYFAPYYYKDPSDNNKIKFEMISDEDDSYDYFTMDWYQIPKELDSAIWSDPYYDEGVGNVVMSTYSVPLYKTDNGSKKFMGILTADVSLHWLEDIISQIHISETGYVFMVSKNGTMVAHPLKSVIMHETIFSIADSTGSEVLRNIGRAMIHGDTSFAEVEYINVANGKMSWIAYVPLNVNGWSLGIVFPVDEFKSDIYKLNRKLVWLGIAGAFILFLVVLVISNQVTRPLRSLTTAADEFSVGNFQYKLPLVKSKDEIGKLNNAFEGMQLALNQTILDLTNTSEQLQQSNIDLTNASEQLKLANVELTHKSEELKLANVELTHKSEELKLANVELTNKSDELKNANAELTQKSEELKIANVELTNKSDELKNANTELTQKSEELKIANAELTNASEQLKVTNEKLAELNRSLEEKVEQRTAELVDKNKELDVALKNISVLSEIGKKITSTLDIEQILTTIYEKVNELMDSTSFGIMIYNKEEDKLECKLSIENGDRLPPFSINMQDKNRFAVWCVDNKEPIFMNNIDEEYHRYIQHRNKPLAGNSVNSMMYIPLLTEDRVLGAMCVQSFRKNTYNGIHFELFQNLATYTSIALDNAFAYEHLDKAHSELKDAQNQLIQAEKMASLGQLTAGIAHEIKNPLNFVNNFSELSIGITDDLREEIYAQKDKIEADSLDYMDELLDDLKMNVQKINEHGKRADSIVKGMLLHSRGKAGEMQKTDVNGLLSEYVKLAYHGMRAVDSSFNVKIVEDYDKAVGQFNVVPQDISRVFLNIINNACYSANEKSFEKEPTFSPTLTVTSKDLGDTAEFRIRDNGKGISQENINKIFNPFFTTKPTGKGTGLGLSLSYDIVVNVHKGELKVESVMGEFAEFIIILPKNLK